MNMGLKMFELSDRRIMVMEAGSTKPEVLHGYLMFLNYQLYNKTF